jgi:purine-binding chemotaxis protein CheW
MTTPPRDERSSARIEAARILDERARELARPPRSGKAEGVGAVEVVRFALAGVVHALETRHAHEVLRAGALAAVPWAPPLLAGVVSLRGALLPVFDLAGLLGSPSSSGSCDRPLLLVLGDPSPDLAVPVDDVLDVVRLSLPDLSPPPASSSPAGGALVLGVALDRTVVLDGAALLADPRLAARDAAPDTRREP